MADNSEQQIETRLLELENQGLADRRAELVDERWLSLIHDQESGRAYVLRHGVDETEGGEVPPDTEFWVYPTFEEAERTYLEILGEARAAGELVDEDSGEGLGDSEVDGAELRNLYQDEDEDTLVVDEAGAPRGPDRESS
jgi:hypothetical protein